MAIRKLIKFGRNSYVISLPKDWLVQQQLKKGSELFLEQKPGSIIITTLAATQRENLAEISVDKKRFSMLETEVIAAYKAGVTNMIICGDNLAENVGALKELFHYLAGAEVIEQELHKLVIKDLIDVRQVALPSLIHRMDVMIRSMFQDTLSDEEISATILRERDRDVNRLQLLIARVARIVLENPAIGTLLNLAPSDAFYYDRVSWTLERFGDYLKRLDDDMIRGKSDARYRLKQHLKKVYDYYLQSMRAFYKRNKTDAIVIHNEIRKKLGTYTRQVYSCENRDEVLALENIKNIMRDLRIILRITVESAFRKGISASNSLSKPSS